MASRAQTEGPSRCAARGPRWLGLVILLLPSPGRAVDLSGSALISRSTTESETVDSTSVDQRFSLRLAQVLTPYLRLRLGYQYGDFTSDTPQSEEFTRSSRRPRVELVYDRLRLSARLAFEDRVTDTSAAGGRFESEELVGNLSWRPLRGPELTLLFRDTTNRADVSALGRDVGQRLLSLSTTYNRPTWTGALRVARNEVDNPSRGLLSEQDRGELRLTASRQLLRERLAVDFFGSVSRVQRLDEVRAGAEIAEPLTAIQGLFAVDTSPELDELEPAPTLIDGESRAPADPAIDIGGANTFRNLGLDLGLTRQVSRLEVFVDRPSGPTVIWNVYLSRDNLVWEPVPGVTAEWDGELLRYVLRFPAVSSRFFKAVNVSVNPEPVVLVTELRALLDLDVAPGRSEFETTLYRANLSARYAIGSRARASVAFGTRTDESLVAGLVRRDFRQSHGSATLGVDLTEDLGFRAAYSYGDSEDRVGALEPRTTEQLSASLRWDPLPTVNAALSASRQDESESGQRIQSTSTMNLSVLTQLLPDLRLTSSLVYSVLDDPFGGIDRETWSLRERIDAQPRPDWTIAGGFVLSRFESATGTPVRDRVNYELGTTWIATAYLTLNGGWRYHRNDGSGTLRQDYAISYAPGPKLAVSAAYQEYDSEGLRSTRNASLSLTYRLWRRAILFGSFGQSQTGGAGATASEVTFARVGLRVSF